MTRYKVFKSWSKMFGGIKFEMFDDGRIDQSGGYLYVGDKEEWMMRGDIAELYRFFRAAHEACRKASKIAMWIGFIVLVARSV